MERLTILAVCLISALAIVTPAVDGQTNAPVVQNGSQGAATGRSHTSNVHPNAPISRNIARGPVSVGPRAINSLPAQMVGQRAMNLRPNYSQFMRPLNPTLAEMSARHVARPDSVQPNQDVLPRSENVQRTMPTASAQRVVAANNLKPISGDLARREISEGLETVNSQRIARNNNLKPISGDLANREPRQRMAKWNHQTGKNRFSYSDALRRNRREWHDRNWWRQHCNTIVFVSGGYYFLDGSYWYPAWGYDPLNNYYDYDGPVYTYGNLLPDEVIANVQVALQEAGYYGGPITGSLSVETRAALANYQRDQGLLITGAIDEPTIESLGLY
jgi:Putative peptidoglycan binding domain